LVTAVRIIHWIITIGLIVVVILQPGRSAGMGVIGGGAEALLGKRKKGLDALLSKVTVFLAVGFLLSSIALAVVSQ
jgi:preprotein translocase subunit SecG